MRPLRVLIVAACPFPWPRGTPIRIRRLAEAVAAAGHDVHVATYHLGQRDEDTPGVTVHRIHDVPGYTRTAPGPTPAKLLRVDVRLRALVSRLLSSGGFDIVHAHHYEGLLVATTGPRPAPVIYDAHTTLAGELPDYRMPLPRSLVRAAGRWMDTRLPRRADAVVAVSDKIETYLESIGAASDIEVIPNGVSWERFADLRPDAPSDEVVIFTGNLAPYQGVELLLEAFAAVIRRRPDARLAVVTSSSFAPYEPLARELGIRHAIDLIDAPFEDQPGLIQRARVAVSPRLECDGIPQKLLNYTACGAAVVAFDGSAAHLVDGETGRRIENGNTDAMGRAMVELLGSPDEASRLGRAAREQTRTTFTWDRMAARVIAMYERILASRRGQGATSAKTR